MTWAMTAMVGGGAALGALTNKDDPWKGAMYGAAIGGTGGMMGGVGVAGGAAAPISQIAPGMSGVTTGAVPSTVVQGSLISGQGAVTAGAVPSTTVQGSLISGQGISAPLGQNAPTTLERGPLLDTGDTGITKAGKFWDKHKGSLGREVKGAAKQGAAAYLSNASKPTPYPQAQPFRPTPYQQPQNPYEIQAGMRKQSGFRRGR